MVQSVSGLERMLEYVGTDREKAFSYIPDNLEAVEITTWENEEEIDSVFIEPK